jgi:Ca2+-binding RTX toxin-like protein
MTYPLDGHAFGFFTPRDKPTLGVIQTTRSDGTKFVRTVYTTSAPGTEPSWKTCGTEVIGDLEDGVKCTIAAADRGSQVTAVGAIANDSATEDEDPILGGYDAANDDSGACSGLFIATLKDQNGNGIAHANLDVHAQNPGDDLFFDTGETATRPPDQAHTKENAIDCTAAPPASAGQQGEVDNPSGPDVKHVESTIGTSDIGEWTFELYSATAGETQFTVWSDLDDDDRSCSTESSASGSVGWGQQAPNPTGIAADVSSCPSPSASSPNPGPTTSTSSTESPDPRGCTITGTDNSEEIDGTTGPDVICGKGGNDVIRALGGDDVVYGDGGNDDIRGGGGLDSLFGLGGKDTIRGDDGADYIEGGDANDILSGGNGRDQLLGQAGFDTLKGGGNPDRLSGGPGQDTLAGGPSNDRLNGGPDADTLRGGSGNDRCDGGGGQDTRTSCEKGSP